MARQVNRTMPMKLPSIRVSMQLPPRRLAARLADRLAAASVESHSDKASPTRSSPKDSLKALSRCLNVDTASVFMSAQFRFVYLDKVYFYDR